MKHTIEIDDNSSAGKSLLGIAKELEGRSKGVRVIDDREEDKRLLSKMVKEKKQGILNEEEKAEFIHSLKRQAGL